MSQIIIQMIMLQTDSNMYILAGFCISMLSTTILIEFMYHPSIAMDILPELLKNNVL